MIYFFGTYYYSRQDSCLLRRSQVFGVVYALRIISALYVLECSHVYRSHEGQHELPNYGLRMITGSLTLSSAVGIGGCKTRLAIYVWRLSRRHLLQYPTPITVCPIVQEGRICRNVRCRLRHDIIGCNQCGYCVLHKGLARHCGFPESQARRSSPAYIIPPLPYPRVRKLSPHIPAQEVDEGPPLMEGLDDSGKNGVWLSRRTIWPPSQQPGMAEP